VTGAGAGAVLVFIVSSPAMSASVSGLGDGVGDASTAGKEQGRQVAGCCQSVILDTPSTTTR
jgi:hypothetical protein